MGYYVQTVDADIFLDKKHFDDVYFNMCELNDYHDLKRGGGGYSSDESDSGSRYPKNKWFSWMPYNYPEIFTTMQEILQEVGFELSFDSDGNLINMSYDNKTGNEDYFLCCLAGYVKDGSYIEFVGEDQDYYKYVFKNGEMNLYQGVLNVTYHYSETYLFGQPSRQDELMLNLYNKVKQAAIIETDKNAVAE